MLKADCNIKVNNFISSDNYIEFSEDPTKEYTTSWNAQIEKSKTLLDLWNSSTYQTYDNSQIYRKFTNKTYLSEWISRKTFVISCSCQIGMGISQIMVRIIESIRVEKKLW